MGTATAAPLPATDSFALTHSAWDILVADGAHLGMPDLTVTPLLAFLKAAEDPAQNPHILTKDERGLILDQAERLIANIYPHLPFKPADFPNADPPVDPLGGVQRLRALVESPTPILAELDFHIEMLKIFASVRDPHTAYSLPHFFRGAVAFLPFRAGYYVDAAGSNRYIVTSVMEGFDHPDFRPGAELVSDLPGFPDFTPIVDRAAALTPGANESAQRQRGTLRLTVFPLSTSGTSMWRVPYEDESASFSYLTPGSTARQSIVFPWGVARATALHQDFPGGAFSMSPDLCAFRYAVNLLWNREQLYSVASLASAASQNAPASPSQPASLFPDVFQFQTTGGLASGTGIDPANLLSAANQFGYIAIKSFNSSLSADLSQDLPHEFARILKLLQAAAPDGLIVDIRGNPGGDIVAAETMLQMLTPAPITPANFHLANTNATLKILNAVAGGNPLSSQLEPWLADRGGLPLPAGPPLTSGQPLTSAPNATGQIYQGPVVLLVDALTYSAADIFAGGFSDNGVGKIIGPDATTGGGGASVWPYSQLLSMLPATDLNLQPLPQGADMSLAFLRSTRVGPNLGIAIEGKGVHPDIICPRTLNDLLASAGNPVVSDLIGFACGTLATMPVHRIDISKAPGAMQINLAATNLDSLQFFLDQAPLPALTIKVEHITQPMNVPVHSDGSAPGQVVVRGFSGGRLAASTRVIFDARALNPALDRRRRD